MSTFYLSIFSLALALLIASAPARAEEERNVPIDDLPQAILNAAMVAVPGIALSEAEIEATETGDVYELEGEADGKGYEIHIAADGTVLGIEMDDDEHGADDDEAEADDDDDKDKDGGDDDNKHDHQNDHQHDKHDG